MPGLIPDTPPGAADELLPVEGPTKDSTQEQCGVADINEPEDGPGESEHIPDDFVAEAEQPAYSAICTDNAVRPGYQQQWPMMPWTMMSP